MVDRLPSSEIATGSQGLNPGTVFNLHLPSGHDKTFVIVGNLAPKFNAGSYVCAELVMKGDSIAHLGLMQPLPDNMNPDVIGTLQEKEVVSSLEQQFGSFAIRLLRWMDGSGPNPYEATRGTENSV